MSLPSARLAAFLLALSPALQSSGKDEELKEAARLLRSAPEAEVRQGAERCLKINSVESIELLLDVLRADQPHYRDIVWEALPRFKNPYARRAVEAELKKNPRKPEHREWCLQLLGYFEDPSFSATAEKFLQDKVPEVRRAAALTDADGRPRLQAVENLSAIRTKGSVDALIRASGDGRPAVREKALNALSEMTEKKWASRDLRKKWRDENRETFEFPESEKRRAEPSSFQTTVSYHGVQVASDRVLFPIDCSAGMGKTLQDGRVKADAALKELDETLQRLLGKGIDFNLLLYAEETEALSKKPLRLDEKSRKAALSFVRDATLTGSKDIWTALRDALADPSVDTVFLLSSGEPEVGLYVHWNRVTEHLKELNRFRKVVVHAVAYSDSKWYREQLEKISEATGGQFVYFE